MSGAMTGLVHRLRRAGRRAGQILGARAAGRWRCGACGFRGRPLPRAVLWPELVEQWQLGPDWHRWMDEREGSCCARCGANLRSGQLAAALTAEMNRLTGGTARHLREACRGARAQRLAIAEINAAGNLHKHLVRCAGLRYSEYGSRDPAVPSQDLLRLSYADASFDLATTSDTMEHVPDIDAALREVRRVLKPGGAYVFTIPVVWDRATRQRAVLHEDGRLEHVLPPSCHGAPGGGRHDMLVFHEFGADAVERCRAAGFHVDLLRDDANPALVTFIARRAQ
jgi:SAM-dependent methyltransferase